jgi:hypothetical protein
MSSRKKSLHIDYPTAGANVSSRGLDAILARLSALNSPLKAAPPPQSQQSSIFSFAPQALGAKTTAVDISQLPLVDPGPSANVMVGTRTGIPNPTQVVVMLLFIGLCATCEHTLNIVKTWFNRANILRDRHGGKNQLEVILVSASRRVENFVSIVQSITNPFYAIPFGSETHHKLLDDFGVTLTDEDALFEPRLVVLEWLGARYHPDPVSPAIPATECRSIRNPIGFIADMHLPPLVAPIDHSEPETRPLITPPPSEELPPADYDYRYLSDDSKYPPIRRVQKVREHCSFYFDEIRDNLFDLRGNVDAQERYISSIRTVMTRICAAPSVRFDDVEKTDQYNRAIEVIRQGVGGVHLLELIGAGRAKRGSSGRIRDEAVPRIDCNYFVYFYMRWHDSFTLFKADLVEYKRHYLSEHRHGRKRPPTFPYINVNADPSRPMYLIRIYYRTSSWTAVRDDFPASIHELRDLVSLKVMNVEMSTARLFSDDLNPMLPEAIFCDGITDSRGSLSYSSLSEIAEHLEAAQTDSGMKKIRIVVMGHRKLLPGEPVRYHSKPVHDKAKLLDQVSHLFEDISGVEMESLWLKQTFKIMSVVVKLAELDELQEQILRRIPVQKLHMKAANSVIKKREEFQKRELPSPQPTLLSVSPPSGGGLSSSFPPPGLSSGWTLSQRAEWDRINYDEELLLELTSWFADKFFSWIPPSIGCQKPEKSCGKNMYLIRTQLGMLDVDDFGQAIEHPLLQPHLIEEFVCGNRQCRHVFRLNRPLQDLNRIIDFPQGRCSEHAKAFHLAVRALGFDARILVGRFRPRESFRDDDPRARKLGSSSDHAWNEVFIDARQEWIPIDPSASETGSAEGGSLGVPKAMRFGHTDMFDHSEFRPYIVASISKEDALILTEKYATDAADVEYARSIWDKSHTGAEVEAVSRIMAMYDRGSDGDDPSQEFRLQRTIHVARLERSLLDRKRREKNIQPRIGKGELVPGPSNMDLRIIGGEIPRYNLRMASTIFHTYDILMRFDHVPMFVCQVDVTRHESIVISIAFGYCLNHKPEEVQQFGPSNSDEMPYTRPTIGETRTVKISPDDWIVCVDTEYNADRLLAEFVPVLASQAPVDEAATVARDNFSKPIVGFYGSHADNDRAGIDFVGFYELYGRSTLHKRSNSGTSL